MGYASGVAASETLVRARALAESRDFSGAESLLREVLSEHPDSLPALDLLGYVLYFLGRPIEAEQVCRRALELAPDHAYALKGLGLCLARRGEIDQAVESIERAIELKPGWFDPYWDLCVVLVEAGRCAQAIEVLSRARAALPERKADWDRMERHARTTGARLR